MSNEIYLHHYPASLFSEKVRAMLGYLGAEWNSVIISNIMPRPLLMPLSGGYRRTPCLQIGANVYCDTAVIAHALARHTGDTSLFRPGFAAERVAEWADSQLFRVAVALNFRPEAVGAIMRQLSASDIEAFGKDRAELAQGGSLQTVSAEAARTCLDAYLASLEASLGEAFLFGPSPSIADFSVYHCLWFLQQNPVNAPLLEPFPNTLRWLASMAGFGHGQVHESTGEAALAHAKVCEPTIPTLPAHPSGADWLGREVDVTPTDYGRIPVRGRLVAYSTDEIVLERNTQETGRVFTHFPTVGFELAASGTD